MRNFVTTKKDFQIIQSNGDQASPFDINGKTFVIQRRYGNLATTPMFRVIDGLIVEPSPLGGTKSFSAPRVYLDAIRAWLRSEIVDADVNPKHS